MSTKAAKKTSQEQPPTEKYDSVHATKKDTQEVSTVSNYIATYVYMYIHVATGHVYNL